MASPISDEHSSVRERILLDADWRFHQGEPAEVTAALDYDRIRAWVLPTSAAFVRDPASLPARPAGNLGDEIAFAQRAFADAAWRRLDLPHDWAIEGPFDLLYAGETGKRRYWGPVWYRKQLAVPAADAGRRFYLELDGAMSYATVWCNGQFVGGWPYGYSSFRLDLTPHLEPGRDNVLAIRLNSPNESSRWYPGAGLYRHVWLVKTNPVQVGQWGTTITTPRVTDEEAEVQVRVAVVNHRNAAVSAVVSTRLLYDGVEVARVPAQTLALNAGATATATASARVARPRRWDVVQPHLYTALTTVRVDGGVVDQVETAFGIRTFRFDADRGFFLNDRPLPLRGVCNHHDFGALGAAFNERAAERQLEIMKEMGVNSLRTSHNMPAPELLDLCDRMGILVMDESFDCWELGKRAGDYGRLFRDWHEQDLRALCRRDRNHPSVFMWSIGNEVRELGEATRGPQLAAQLSAIVHQEDPTRPTVVGSNVREAGYNGIQRNVDVMGQNYETSGYAEFRQANPGIPLVASETSSCVSSRGEYFFQEPGQPPVSEDKSQGRAQYQISSYDLYGPGWSRPPDAEFAALDQNPHVAGEYVWTGFDYLGEPTPYNKDPTNLLNFQDDAEGRARMEKELKELALKRIPSRSSYFGIVDLAGFKKDRFYSYQARWRPELPMVHLLPHWTWPERVGLVTPVHVYTSGDEAELWLNGRSQGRRKKGSQDYRLRWNDVVYEPGELRVVAYKEGRRWAEEVVNTAGPAAQLILQPDRAEIKGDGRDLSFVAVTVADAAGRLVPRANPLVTLALAGPGEIVATDNGDATSLEPFQTPRCKAYNGLLLAIVRARPGQTGALTLTATAEGLAPARIILNSVT